MVKSLTVRRKSMIVLAAVLGVLLAFTYAAASYYFFPLVGHTQSENGGYGYYPANDGSSSSSQSQAGVSWVLLLVTLAFLLITGASLIAIYYLRNKKHSHS